MPAETKIKEIELEIAYVLFLDIAWSYSQAR